MTYSEREREFTFTENHALIKSGNGYKNPWNPPKEVRETTVGRIYGKGKLWVWSEREKERCTVSVDKIQYYNISYNKALYAEQLCEYMNAIDISVLQINS